MKIKWALRLLPYLVVLVNPAEAYVLKNDFYIFNHSKNVMDVSYNSCIYKWFENKEKTICEANYVELSPGQAKKFIVDSMDNSTDGSNWYKRTVYVYQAISPVSLGLFNYNDDDYKQYKKDYADKDTNVPDVITCSAASGNSVILEDYGTDKIYCIKAY